MQSLPYYLLPTLPYCTLAASESSRSEWRADRESSSGLRLSTAPPALATSATVKRVWGTVFKGRFAPILRSADWRPRGFVTFAIPCLVCMHVHTYGVLRTVSYDSVNRCYAKLTNCQCAPIVIAAPSDYRDRVSHIRMRVSECGRWENAAIDNAGLTTRHEKMSLFGVSNPFSTPVGQKIGESIFFYLPTSRVELHRGYLYPFYFLCTLRTCTYSKHDIFYIFSSILTD